MAPRRPTSREVSQPGDPSLQAPRRGNAAHEQEVGHTLGLDHQSTDGSSLNTCMDYYHNASADTLSIHPNQHDYDELGLIHAPLDSITTVKASPARTAAAVLDAPTASRARRVTEHHCAIAFGLCGCISYESRRPRVG